MVGLDRLGEQAQPRLVLAGHEDGAIGAGAFLAFGACRCAQPCRLLVVELGAILQRLCYGEPFR